MSRLFLIAAAVALLAGAAQAQPAATPAVLPPMPVIPGATNVRLGQTLARPADKPGPKVELYAFIGEAGAILQAAATGAAGYGLTLYTPEGAPMLEASGLGSAQLDAVLPLDGVYLLAVARQDAAKPFKLALSAERPDLFQWSFRDAAGYEILTADGKVSNWSCWILPGAVLRFNLPDGRTVTQGLQRGGDGRWEGLPGVGSYSFTTRMEGSRFVRTNVDTGEVQTWSLDDPPQRRGAYRRYLCPN